MTKAVAFIPARSGSKRVPHKNIRPLGGHPLIAYSVRAAIDSGVFDAVVCATDSERYAEAARHYGAEVPFLRSGEISGDTSPDIEWVEWMLDALRQQGREFDAFSILRPTSPFRKPETIRRAWAQFVAAEGVDSLRAVEKCQQHPGKMWVLRGERMVPLLPLTPEEQPWHSSQYAALPAVYVQNASLEIAWTRVVRQGRTIAGQVLAPFLTIDEEGLDVNNNFDWWHAEHLLERGEATLPAVGHTPWKTEN
jgi:CMP-N-acetylneuraminic acid synthetase